MSATGKPFIPIKGTEAKINNVPISEGNFLIAKDSKKIFVDVDDTTRIQAGGGDVSSLYAALDGKADKTHSHIPDDITGLDTMLDGIAPVQAAYAELKTLVAANKLKPGLQYVLTDYVTKYRQPYSNVIKTADNDAGTVERLVLTAISPNAFDPQCASLDWPNDVVFYDFNDNVCEDDTTPRNGFIQRRIDTKTIIDMPHDWRTMVWARFKATAQTWSGGAVARRAMYQSGSNLYMATRAGTPANATDAKFFQLICTTNDYYWTRGVTLTGLTYNTTDYAQRYTFNADASLTLAMPTKHGTAIPERVEVQGGSLRTESALRGLANNVWAFAGATESSKPSRIFAVSGFYNNTFGSNCYNNTFGTGCHSNTLGATCPNNTFGSNCHSNTFGSTCHSNTFGSNCYSNTFGAGCTHNTFGSSCYNNTFGLTCASNAFGAYCASNTTGSDFSYNTFGPSCSNNTVADKFWNVTIDADGTHLGRDMSGIPALHTKIYTHRIFVSGAGLVHAMYYSGSSGAPAPNYIYIP